LRRRPSRLGFGFGFGLGTSALSRVGRIRWTHHPIGLYTHKKKSGGLPDFSSKLVLAGGRN